jgi:hypothetical protein
MRHAPPASEAGIVDAGQAGSAPCWPPASCMRTNALKMSVSVITPTTPPEASTTGKPPIAWLTISDAASATDISGVTVTTLRQKAQRGKHEVAFSDDPDQPGVGAQHRQMMDGMLLHQLQRRLEVRVGAQRDGSRGHVVLDKHGGTLRSS